MNMPWWFWLITLWFGWWMLFEPYENEDGCGSDNPNDVKNRPHQRVMPK